MARITPRHPRWREFCDQLAGPNACAFTDTANPSGVTWRCDHTYTHTTRILRDLGLDDHDIDRTVAYFARSGGGCDCEILLNLDADTDLDVQAVDADELDRIRDNR